MVGRDTQAPKVTILSPENNARVGIRGAADGSPDGTAAPSTVDVTGSVDIDKEPNLDTVIVQTAVGSVTA